MNTLVNIVLALLALLAFLYHVATRKYNYWKNKNVPYAKPIPFFGNYKDYILQKRFTSLIAQDLCKQFPKEPYFGTFFGTEPALIIQDPEIIKLVMTKDYYYFSSRELMDYCSREVITQNMFFSYGDKWKVVRQGLTPLFSSAKIKSMFYLIRNCAHTFEDMLDYETGITQVFDSKILMTRYTMDCICSCAFGIDVKTMQRDQDKNPFLEMGQLIFSTSLIRGYMMVLRAMWPHVFYNLGLKVFPDQISNFFHNILVEVFQGRGYEPSQRNDFVDLVLGLKKNKVLTGDSITNLKTGGAKKVEIEVTDDFLVSQCVMFFGAGFETSAGTLNMTIYEIAKNQEVQKRAQQEVDEFLKKNDNKITYDCVTELPYLDACVTETLRLYPVLPVLTREVVETYRFPSGLQLEKGTRIHLPLYHIHRNEDNFPDPEQFKPERFLPGADDEVRPYTFLPFGEGPRTCIGMRFSKMQVLPGLVTFLKKYHVQLAEGTPETFPHQTTLFTLQPACDLPVRVTLREGWEGRRYKR